MYLGCALIKPLPLTVKKHTFFSSQYIKIVLSIFSLGLHGLPKRSGKLKDISKFDATFFGVHPKQANGMDPQLRMLLEVTYEAIVDAGKKY